MHATCKDGAEGDPQEHHGAPQSTLQCTEDGTQPAMFSSWTRNSFHWGITT